MPIFSDEHDEEQDDDLFSAVSRMADRMGLKGDKRENYIDDHMTQGGYSRVQTRESYAKIQRQEGDQEEGSSRWFGGRQGGGGGRQRQGGRNDDPDRY